MPMQRPQRPRMVPIPLIYAIVSATWIATSDYLLALLPSGAASQTFKGLFFVFVTTCLLQRLIARNCARVDEYVAQLAEGARLRAIGDVTARLSHDLRNLLMGADMMVSILERSAGDSSQAENARRLLGSVLRRSSVLLEEVTGYAKERQVVRETIVLADWLSEFVEEMSAIVGDHVVVPFFVEPADLTVCADATQLHRLLMNLVINAEQAIEGSGVISIEARHTDDGSRVMLAVRDSGTGMPPHVAEHVFEPLFSTKSNGTGLGLAIVADIATAHGGSVSCESTQGCGTAFQVMLPRWAAAS